VFKSVEIVTSGDDSGAGSLRQAVATANSAGASSSGRPILIRFDHKAIGGTSGSTAEIELSGPTAVTITAPGTVIDGTNGEGNPSPIGAFGPRRYRTLIRQTALTSGGSASGSCAGGGGCNLAPAGKLLITAPDVELVGLDVQRTLAADPSLCCGDVDLVTFGAGSAGSRLRTCRLSGGAHERTNASGADGSGTSTPPQGKDCVDANSTGGTVTVEDSEIRFCFDRGIKSQSGVVHVEGGWIHHNLRGGLFALNPNGTIEAVGNLIEQNGRNCPMGSPSGCGSQVDARTDASQIAAQAGSTKLTTRGNVLRDGVLHGLFFQSNSEGNVRNDYICRMNGVSNNRNGKGIQIEKSAGTASQITVRGTTVAYNRDHGVKFEQNVGADFGTDSSGNAGNNAFVWNGGFTESDEQRTERNFAVLDNVPTVMALGNQWQHCYPNNLEENACDDQHVSDLDTNNSAAFDRVDNQFAKPHAGDVGPQETKIESNDGDERALTPSKVALGQIVRIEGTGFNAIGGHDSSNNCHDLTAANCNGLNGTCVEFQESGKPPVQAEILGVTPTHIVVRSPITCHNQVTVRVRRKRLGGQEIPQNDPNLVHEFCVNQ
jgi:hypothetical protein